MTSSNFLLTVYLRGGADGLTFLPLYDHSSYHAGRDVTSVPKPEVSVDSAIHLTEVNSEPIGIHPALTNLKSLYDSGRASFILGCGSPDRSRSHFTQQFHTEMGWTSTSINKSKLGLWSKYFDVAPPPVSSGGAPLLSPRGIALTSVIPDLMRNSDATLPVPDPANFSFPAFDDIDEMSRLNLLRSLYGATGFAEDPRTRLHPHFAAMERGFDVIDGLSAPDSAFSGTPLGADLAYAAQLAALSDGPQMVQVDSGGWDTHADQGVNSGGHMYGLMADLDHNLNAFLHSTSAASVAGVTILVLSEFGRSIQENESGGTDHGRGGIAMVLGDGLRPGSDGASGKMILKPNKDNDLFSDEEGGDLVVGVDIRSVQGEILGRRMGLGITELQDVFDGVATTDTEEPDPQPEVLDLFL